MSAEPDDVTQRTRLAMDAEIEAQKAQTMAQRAQRMAKHSRWWYSAGLLVVSLVGAGYALHERVDHFAGKEQLEELKGRQDLVDRKQDILLEQMAAQKEMTTRMANQIEKLSDHFFRERGRGQR